jgi:transposase
VTKTRQQLQAFLLRHQRVHAGRAWTRAHRRWLADLRFDHPAQQIVLQDYVSAIEDAAARVARLMRQIEELVPTWAMAAVVDALQATRGVSLLAAVTLVAEVGDFRRFANPRQLMACRGWRRSRAEDREVQVDEPDAVGKAVIACATRSSTVSSSSSRSRRSCSARMFRSSTGLKPLGCAGG